MKKCPSCSQVFDDSNDYCLNDGTALVPDTGQQSAGGFQSSGEMPTQYLRGPQPTSAAPVGNPSNVLYLIIGILATALVGVGIYFLFLRDSSKPAEKANANVSPAKETPTPASSPQATPGSITNIAIPAAPPPVDPNLTATGRWSGEISYSYGAAFSAQADFTDSGGGQVRGQIVWTVLRSKNPRKKDKVGMSATELVQGTFDASSRVLTISGTSVSDPSLIIKDKYRLTMTPDGRSMSGASFGGKVPGRVTLRR